MKEIYTIGHSSYPVEYLLKRLLLYSINCVIDVRSTPYSQYTPQYNAPDLKNYLHSEGVYYLFMGKELGARQPDQNLYTDDGYLDFDRFSKTNIFQSAIRRLNVGVAKGFKIALMCTEKDPIDCHRNILVAKELYSQGYFIKNILDDGKIEIQDALERRLLDMYFPNRNQVSIFDLLEGEQNEGDLICKAYKLRNRDIGYRLHSKTEGG